MVLRSYALNKLLYSDIQFATAIALDELNEVPAAKAVLSFMKPDVYYNADATPEGTSRYILEKKLEQMSEELHCNLLEAVLNYYFSEQLFSANSGRLRTGSGTEKCSLEKLVRVTTVSALYAYIMRMLANTKIIHLIARYTKTTMFKEQFFNFVKNEEMRFYNGRSYKVNLTVIDQLLDGFTDFVQQNCANGSYHTASCDPDSFLFKKKNSDGTSGGPVAWYQQQKDGLYYRILNSSGTNSEIKGADGLAKIDSISLVEDEEDDVDFAVSNFIGWCSKIYKASALLFSHAQMRNLYYDIFSYHRNCIIEKDGSNLSKQKYYGCSIHFSHTQKDICSDSLTLIGKYNSHARLCDIFEDILYKNIGMEDISVLYNRIIKITELSSNSASGAKDGKLIFDVPGHRTKAMGTGNGERFFILLNGYLALKQLLEFLNSNSNTLGVTLYNFPVDIFRYHELLIRVKSFREYIEYGQEIKKLYLDALNDSEPNLSNGLRSNDSVYRVLETNHKLRYDANVKAFSATPISVIKNSLKEFKQASTDITSIVQVAGIRYHDLTNPLNKFADSFGLRSVNDLLSYEKLRSLGIVKINLAADSVALTIMARAKEYGIKSREEPFMWYLIGIYSTILRAASSLQGDKPVAALSGEYLIRDKTLLSSVFITDEFERRTKRNPQQFLINRVKAIRICMCILCGKLSTIETLADSKIPLKSYDLAWKDYWDFWCITTKVARYVKEISITMDALKECGSDSGLYLIYATSKMEFMGIPQIPESVHQLEVLEHQEDPEFFVNFKETSQFRDARDRQHRRMLFTFRNILEAFKEQTTIFKILLGSANTLFKDLSLKQVRYNPDDKNLTVGIAEINALKMSGHGNAKIAYSLALFTSFDNMGFVTLDGERFVMENPEKKQSRRFIHSEGFFVELTMLDEQAVDVIKMTESDLEQVRLQLL